MKSTKLVLLIFFLTISLSACGHKPNLAIQDISEQDELDSLMDDDFDDDFADKNNGSAIYDPLEPLNRFFFGFNHILQKVVIKPFDIVYDILIPDLVQNGISNVFHNAATPVYLVGNILQGDWEDAGKEIVRFGLNTTIGFAGLADVATDNFDITTSDDEDIGQVFASWGIGEGIYIVWPFVGSSNSRDSLGFIGDLFLTPSTYIGDIQTQQWVNGSWYMDTAASMSGDYLHAYKAFVDPYVGFRQAYYDYRRKKINN